MPLTLAAKDAALMMLFHGRSLYLGLMSEGRELLDLVTYQRQPIAFGMPMGESERKIVNSVEAVFSIPEPVTVDGWLIAEGDGTVLAQEGLEEPLQMGRNQEVIFRTGELSIGLANRP